MADRSFWSFDSSLADAVGRLPSSAVGLIDEADRLCLIDVAADSLTFDRPSRHLTAALPTPHRLAATGGHTHSHGAGLVERTSIRSSNFGSVRSNLHIRIDFCTRIGSVVALDST